MLTEVHFPADVRLDGWVATGSEVSAFYDPMIAKLIVHGADREQALEKLRVALAATRLHGIATNLDYLRQVIATPQFQRGEVWTRLLDDVRFQPHCLEVLQPGTYSSVQDYPGRLGYWDIGVPPSGPMDDFAFRLANRIVGNHPAAAGLEFTLQADAAFSLRRHHRADGCQLPGRFGRRSGRLLAADRGAGRAGADAGARHARLPHLSGGTQRL